MPLPVFALHEHVSGLLGINTSGVSVSTTYAQGDECIVANPSFATGDASSVALLVKGKTNSSGIRFGAKLLADSAGKLQPTVVAEKGTHSVEVNPVLRSVEYGYVTRAVMGSVKTLLLDGLSSNAQWSAALTSDITAGVAFDYDPSRSGLKSFTYGAVATNPSCLNKAVVSATISNPNVVSLGITYAVLPQYSALFYLSRSANVKLGVGYTSPCGAKVALYADPTERKVGLSAKRRIGQWWTVAVGVSSDLTAKGKLSAGISFTDE